MARLRRLYESELPALIDHAEPLLAEKASSPGVPLYFTADTHWTPYGGAIAVRQLMAVTYPGMEIPPPQLSGATRTRKTDLAAALQWPVEEQAGEVAPLPQTILDELNRRSADVRTLIAMIHSMPRSRASFERHSRMRSSGVERHAPSRPKSRALIG